MADSRKCSVFVGNLDPNTSDEVFRAYFRIQCSGVRPGTEGGKIVRHENGSSKKYGFVNFVDAASANRVVAKKNHIIDGRKVICKIQNRKRKPVTFNKNRTEPKYLREVHVRNLNVSTTNQQFRDYFQKFGSIVNAYIALDENKRSKGFGFVEFQNSSFVEELQDKRPHIISNKEVQTVRSYPSAVPTHLKKPTTVLFVLNYSEKVEEDDIEEYFGEFGNITSVSSHKKKRPGTLEDFKYVELQFDDYDAVDKICLADKLTINGCTVRVTKCLEDVPNEEPGTSNSKSAKTSARKAGNLKDMGMASAPVPSAPLFPAEELNQAPYNPYYGNVGHQQPPSYPSHETRPNNPPPRPPENLYGNVRSNLYPSFESTPGYNPQPKAQNTAPSSSRESFRKPPARPPVPPQYARTERKKEDCIIL